MDRGRARLRGSVAVVAALTAGCAMRQAGEAAAPAPADVPAQAARSDIQSIVESAVRDAASRLDVDPETIEVVSANPVTWSDGSLGCPVEGMMYTQALVPGYRVILRAAGQALDYHAAANGHITLCPPERAIEPIRDERT